MGIAFMLCLCAIVCYSQLSVQAAGTGSASTTGSVVVPVATTVLCTSSTITALPGTQTNTLTVVCTLTGNPNNLNTSNSFIYPATLNSGGRTVMVTPVSTVTSPDGTVTGISGTYSSFSGTLRTGVGNIWKVQSTCTIDTTATTPSGTYTGTVTYNWSTL